MKGYNLFSYFPEWLIPAIGIIFITLPLILILISPRITFRKIVEYNIITIYVFSLLSLTLGGRSSQCEVGFILRPFWNYRFALSGDVREILDILLNILLFVPMGMILEVKNVQSCRIIVFVCFFVSFCIETLQILMRIGYFETDDLIHNTLGGFLGYVIVKFAKGIIYK